MCGILLPRRSVPKPKRDDPEQSPRGIATGKAAGADKNEGAMERALKKIAAAQRKPAPRQARLPSG